MNFTKSLIGCMVLMTICVHANKEERALPQSRGTSSSSFVRVLAGYMFSRGEKMRFNINPVVDFRSAPPASGPVSPLSHIRRAHVRSLSEQEHEQEKSEQEPEQEKSKLQIRDAQEFSDHANLLRLLSSEW